MTELEGSAESYREMAQQKITISSVTPFFTLTEQKEHDRLANINTQGYVGVGWYESGI